MLVIDDPIVSKYAKEVIKNFMLNDENRTILNEGTFGNVLDTKIYLSTQIPLNACIITPAIPPMVIISKGVFYNEKGKRRPIDLLANILGHELVHKIINKNTITDKEK